jgi:hypothetical protein
VLKKYYVNIVDLVDARNSNRLMNEGVFNSRNKLSKYIIESGKVYALGAAKSNPLLKQFLIQVFHR